MRFFLFADLRCSIRWCDRDINRRNSSGALLNHQRNLLGFTHSGFARIDPFFGVHPPTHPHPMRLIENHHPSPRPVLLVAYVSPRVYAPLTRPELKTTSSPHIEQGELTALKTGNQGS